MYNVVLLLGVEQSDSVIHITCIRSSSDSFSHRLLQNIE